MRPVRRLPRHPGEAAEEQVGGESGSGVIRNGTRGSSTVYAIRSQKIARFVRIRTRGSARSRTSERSTGIVFVFPAGIADRGDRGLPSTAAVGDFEDGTEGLRRAALRQRHVDRGVGVEDPAGQVEHHGPRGARLRERQHQVVGRDEALVARGSETRQMRAVLNRDLGGAVHAVSVHRPGRPRAGEGQDLLRGKRRRNHLLVRDDLDAGRPVHRRELGEIEVRRLPELLGEVEDQPPRWTGAGGRREPAATPACPRGPGGSRRRGVPRERGRARRSRSAIACRRTRRGTGTIPSAAGPRAGRRGPEGRAHSGERRWSRSRAARPPAAGCRGPAG